MAYRYRKLNKRPVKVERVPDEHEEKNDFRPSFWWFNKRYFTDDFVKVHNNPWFGPDDGIPEYIHGIEADQYYKPLFIGYVNGGEAVNIYSEEQKRKRKRKQRGLRRGDFPCLN